MDSLETKPVIFCNIRAAYAVSMTHKPAIGFLKSKEILLDFLIALTGTLSADWIRAGKWLILVAYWLNHQMEVSKVQHCALKSCFLLSF